MPTDPSPISPIPSGRDAGSIEKALQERVKELNCLYGITRLAQQTDWPRSRLLESIADLLCRSWQFPEITRARITIDDHEFATPEFRTTPWVQSSEIRIRDEVAGLVEVCYLEARPPSDEGPFLREERNLLDAAADLIGRILDQRRAEARLRDMSRELILAQETERQRIARELHDHLAQDLSLAKADLDDVLLSLKEEQGKTSRLHPVRETLTRAISSIRNLAYGLIPPGLTELGLVPSTLAFCEAFSARNNITVDVYADGMDNLDLDFEIQINLYRLVQEGLANIRKHSGAEHAVIRLLGSYPSILLRIEDNGCGADLKKCLSMTGREKSMGLWSMRERVRLLDGRITFRSQPGKGMKILVEVPAMRRHNEQA
jgi:signal transduction histidine kinase